MGLPGTPILDEELRALQPLLLRFALRATRDPETSRDLAQEALLGALETGVPFAGRSSLRSWVLGILSHKILDHLRRRHEVLEGEDGDGLLDTASPEDVERTVMARQDLGRVEAALSALPARERLALLLTDVEGLDRAAVCHALNVSPTYLRVLLHRGRNRLRRLL
jgi:RNA polymerase sigma-70 factor (ECF subfamily)